MNRREFIKATIGTVAAVVLPVGADLRRSPIPAEMPKDGKQRHIKYENWNCIIWWGVWNDQEPIITIKDNYWCTQDGPLLWHAVWHISTCRVNPQKIQSVQVTVWELLWSMIDISREFK